MLPNCKSNLAEEDKKMQIVMFRTIPLIRSPIRLWTGRSSPSPPGALRISLQSADLAQPGMPESLFQQLDNKECQLKKKKKRKKGSKS